MSELLPCPFCGAGETRIDEQKYWTGRSSQVISASVKHWCPKNPMTSLIELRGKTKADAIAAWNRRATTPAPAEGMGK